MTVYRRYVRRPKWIDFEAIFKRYKGDPHLTILNHIPFTDPNYVDTVAKTVFARGNQTEFISSCACGHMTGNFLEGMTCKVCHTVVVNDMESGRDGYPVRTWFEVPDQLPHGWLHPIAYRMLKHWSACSRTKKDDPKTYLDIILDPDYPLREVPPEIYDLASRGRGFTFLHDNWKEFIDTICRLPKYTKEKKRREKTAEVLENLELFKDRIWIKHTPVLHNSLHALIAPESDDRNKKSYTDKNSRHITQIASALNYIHFEGESISQQRLNRMIYQSYRALAEYTTYISAFMVDKKPGIARQHVFGARHHWSIRGVIVPLTGKHDLDELHVPWSAMVNSYRVELVGRFVNELGMTPADAWSKFDRALTVYDPDVEMFLKRFIETCPYKGLPYLFNRPPTVRPGSLELFFITKVKTDLEDNTIGMSPYAVTPFNADCPFFEDREFLQ